MKNPMLMVNDRFMQALTPRGNPALDFIREELSLTGTKEGCREGDCGACAVLVGEKISGIPRYRAYPSCLLATGDLFGRHLITIEGLTGAATEGLTPVMNAFLEENASQCGFCSPGFIIALTAWIAESTNLDLAGAMTAVDGNLCRCTGYGSIRRAAMRLVVEFSGLPGPGRERLEFLVDRQVLPPSVIEFCDSTRLEKESGEPVQAVVPEVFLGGGTDYFVRNPEPDADFAPMLFRSHPGMSDIGHTEIDGRNWLKIGAATNVTDFFASDLLLEAIPGLKRYENRFASTLVRNLATVGGNLVNASPVADLTAILLAVDAEVGIAALPDGTTSGTKRIPLKEFYLDYKKTALGEGEFLESVFLPLPGSGSRHFSFEKISKRENLDIAAVNTAMSFTLDKGTCREVRISAGGVAPIPRLLHKTSALVEGQKTGAMSPRALADLALRTAEMAAAETVPIDDVRGKVAYRKRMVSRLVIAHFVRFFGDTGMAEELYP